MKKIKNNKENIINDGDNMLTIVMHREISCVSCWKYGIFGRM